MIWALIAFAACAAIAFILWCLCRVAADSDKWYEDHQ